MISELKSWPKLRKLAPLKPAPITSRPPSSDHAPTARRPDLRPRTATPAATMARARPRQAWTASAAAPCPIDHTTLSELFVACLQLPADPRQVSAEARRGPLDGAQIVERFLAQWEEDPADPGRSLVTLVQAVSSAPEVARALREFLTERVWAHRRHGDPDAVARTAALVSSQLLGTAWARYVIRMEPFASASRSQVAAWVGPTIEAYANGTLGAGPDPAGPGPGA